MPKLQANPCPKCQKPLELFSEMCAGKETLQIFECGHAFVKGKIEINPNTLKFNALDLTGHVAREYQREGVEFLLKSLENGTGSLLADQMRLGKTPQALLTARNYDKWPILILVRASNVYQWVRETKKWCNNLPAGVWVIEGTKSFIPPGFSVYIISMDTFGRRGTCKLCKHQYHEEKCGRKKCDCRVFESASDAMSDKLLEFGFKLCIVDEAHSMKNSDAQRTRALTAFLKNIERSELQQDWTFTCPFMHSIDQAYEKLGLSKNATQSEIDKAFKKKAFLTHPDHGGTNEQFRDLKDASLILKNGEKTTWIEKVTININTTDGISNTHRTSPCPICNATISQSAAIKLDIERNCKLIFLTGTPIKNRADEYFVPLNLLDPAKFPSQVGFRRKYLMENDGSWSRVAPQALNYFKEAIRPIVLRREKEDIYKELPKFNRIFTTITIDDERLKKAYNAVIDEIEGKMFSKESLSYFDSIGELQRLRQICGLAKVGFVADYAETFVNDSEKAKLAIGYHHHAVRDALWYKLEKFGVCKLDGQDSPQQKDYIAHKYFEKSDKQIILLGEQACKEGIELVYIDYALMTERQWTSTDEEQFEFRFFNPDLGYLKSRGLENKVTTVEYIIAKNTIDQFFGDLVEEKRAIFGETVSNNWSLDQDSGAFRELLERTVAGRL